MSKSIIAVAIGIIVTSIVAGMLFGIGLKTGISPDEGSLSLLILQSFCKATQGIGTAVIFNCWSYLAMMTVVVAVIGIVDVMAAAAAMKDWRIGLALYGFGWVVGVLMVVGS